MLNKKVFLESFSFVTSEIDDGIRIGTNKFDLKNGISGTFTDSSLSIPPYISGKPVVELALNSLSGLDIKTIKIAGTVKRMLQGALYSCTKLEHVYFLKNNGKYSLTQLGDGVFDTCKSLKYIFIPPSVSSLPSYLFIYCASLITVVYCGSSQFTQTYRDSFWPTEIDTNLYVSPNYAYNSIAGKKAIKSYNHCIENDSIKINPFMSFFQVCINIIIFIIDS